VFPDKAREQSDFPLSLVPPRLGAFASNKKTAPQGKGLALRRALKLFCRPFLIDALAKVGGQDAD
jgi:hypothetical protein